MLWELASRWAKFCEILSHSVRYGMYGYWSLIILPSIIIDKCKIIKYMAIL